MKTNRWHKSDLKSVAIETVLSTMKFKNILPFESFVLLSALSIEEIKKRLSENVETKKKPLISFFATRSAKPYEGELSGNGFQITRVINYRNSFLPVITGTIGNYGTKTIIRINMRLAIPVIVFICIWLSMTGFIGLSFLASGLITFKKTNGADSSFVTFIPFIMFLFGCLLTILPFKFESRKSKQFLTSLLEGEELTDDEVRMQ